MSGLVLRISLGSMRTTAGGNFDIDREFFPCIGVCSATSQGDKICQGCKRSDYDILRWNQYNNETKRKIMRGVQVENVNFGLAIEELKAGRKCFRKGWNGKGIFIELQRPDENSRMSSPYIFIDTTGLETENENAPKSRVPWLASQTDMLAEDWCSDRVY